MLAIALVCRYGASTSMLANKIKEYGENQNIEMEVDAYPEDELENIVDNYDVVLFGPQLAFKTDYFLEKLPDKAYKFIQISPVDFGRMNANEIVENIRKKLGL